MSRHVELFLSQLFALGLETYNKDEKDSITKGVVNPGGAKVFFHPGWKAGRSPIQILNKDLDKVLKELPITLGTLNRIQLDKDNKPVRVPGSNGYNRTHTGLIIYPLNDTNPAIVLDYKNRIVEAVLKGSGIDISDYIEVGAKAAKFSNIGCLSDIRISNFARDLVPLKPEACIFTSLPSGAPGGAQFWTFQNNKITSRRSMSASVTEQTDGDDLVI